MNYFLPTFLTLVHVLFVSGVILHIIRSKPQTGVALAWLFLVALLPIIGVVIYMLIGERRVNPERLKRLEQLHIGHLKFCEATTSQGLSNVDWSKHPATAEGMDQLGRLSANSPTVHGSTCEMLSETEVIFHRLKQDIDAAKSSLLMEFYIWNKGGLADEILQSVIDAAKRGVSCRVLIDAMGARSWWKGDQPQTMRDAGVQVLQAWPVGIIRSFFGRTDLRMHRKIVVIDGEIAWTGSMNLVDPKYFKADSGVGEWVDAMTRVQGTAVAQLAVTMASDWLLECEETADEIIASADLGLGTPNGEADIQVIRSGPGTTSDALLQMLLALINAATETLTLTTPYFVPDDSLLRAIRGAAGRGVQVKMILPAIVDSLMTRYASQSYYDDLLEMGVEIHLYKAGLLHTKSILVDDQMAMFGTVNLDMRSIWLNQEVAMFVYDTDFATDLHALQSSYLTNSEMLNPETWKTRSDRTQLLESTFRLASPLL